MQQIKASRKKLFYLSLLTLVGMTILGLLLILFVQQKPLMTVLHGPKRPFLQVSTGIFFGSLAALLGILLINARPLHSIKGYFVELVFRVQPNLFHILFYSVSAGVGEEFLFRAGIQPMIGIWPAAIIFVALHGYINPANFSMTLYGLFLIIICSGFGYLFRFLGIWSSISAHIVYDLGVFSALKYSSRQYRISSQA